MLEELPKLGFLQDKKIFYYSLRHIYNTLNYEEMQGFSPEQKDDFANIKKEIAEKLDILEQELLYCPVCCHYVSEFLPLSDYYAENAKKYGCIFKTEDFEMINEKQYSCPICYASDRERFYALFINYMKEKILNENENQKVKIVDFAPSLSLGKFIKNQNLFEYRTADLFMENVDDKVDITDLNIYKTGSFDAFICSHVLEHVIDDKKALRELYRILKPSGGWGILVVPIHLTLEHIYEDPSKTSPEERWMHFGQDDHVRVYSKNGFRERISEAGFAVEEYGKDFFGEDLLKKCGITSQSVIYIGFKNIDKDKLLADGKKYLKENDYENAELNFSQLVELENYNPDYLKILAEAQMNLKKYDQAIDNLSECLQILGVNYEICYSLAKCLDAVGDSEVAEIYYKKAEELRI